MLSFVPRSNFARTMYVLFLNKLYFDELYSVYIVQPTLRFVRWLWQVLDVRGIDGLIHGLARNAILSGQWLWRVVDVRGIDRAVVDGGNQGVGLAGWPGKAVDVRRIEKSSDKIGRAADASGKKLNDVEPRTIQHHLVVLIAWSVGVILFFYWFVL